MPIDPPGDLKPKGRGRRFWRAILAVYELTPDETEVLAEAARSMDRIDALREDVEKNGLTSVGSRGQTVINPALVEERQQRLVLSRLLAQLKISDAIPGEGQEGIPSLNTLRARKAARTKHGDAGVGGTR